MASISGVATRTRPERVVTSKPLAGTRIPVEVATHVTGTLLFASGAAVSMRISFDVPRHKHVPIELYGEIGSLIVPDPNYFGGRIEFADAAEDWREIENRHAYADDNYRISALPTWRRRSAPDGRIARAERSHSCARGDGGVPDLVRRRQVGRDSTRPERPAPMPASLAVGELD